MGGCPTGTAPGSFPRGGRKRGLQTDLQNEIVQEIEDLLARQSIADLDLEALEMAARCQALRLAARALEQRLNTDTSDYVGPALPCPCGGVARYHGRHGKTFESVLGPLHLKRAYYDCGRCHQGFCPRDRALKLESFSLTPGVLRMTASAAALMSFEDRKSTRLNSSHGYISYAVFCLKKKKNTQNHSNMDLTRANDVLIYIHLPHSTSYRLRQLSLEAGLMLSGRITVLLDARAHRDA